MALTIPSAACWGVVLLLVCALGTEAQQSCCYGRRSVPHGQTVLTIPSCCVTFTCSNGDIRPTHFGGFMASGCCEFGGLLYPNGSQLSAHCFMITCVEGNWTLSGRIQDCCAHCSLYNMGHVSTFDNTHYHWAGACNYTATQTGSSTNPDVGVFTSFKPCLFSFCLDHTTFRNDPYTVVSLSHVYSAALFTIKVNGNAYTVAPGGVQPVHIGTTTYPLLVWRTSNCLFLLGSSGLMLQHCPNRLDVWAYPTHTSQLHGLCGHFNFNPLDDMTARNGTVYPADSFPLAFPESWRTAEQSNVYCRQPCRDCTNPTRSDTCKASLEERKAYHVLCAKVLHPVLAVDEQLKHLVEACVQELCLLYQAGVSQQQQQRQINYLLSVAQISKIILARTLGDFVPEPLFAPLDGVCTADSSWQQDCNRCGCSSGVPGLARCTRRACLDDFVPPLGEEYCTNGSRWRPDECNVCECIRNGQVCSVQECSGASTSVTESPIPTGTFRPIPTITFFPWSVCHLPKDAGSCGNYVLRWYYDQATGRCTQFFFSGCGGNPNNFDTENECKLMCGNFLSTLPTTEFPRKPSGCYLPPEVGPCKAELPRYYYNPASDQCEKFIYGGCNGNFNRFTTFEECRATCGGGDAATTVSPSVCHLRWDPGTCSERKVKYYYHAETNQCFVAHYSGCGGNGNRFDTVTECMQTCGATGTTATITTCPPSHLACPLDCGITFVTDPVTNCPKCVCVSESTSFPTLPTAPTHRTCSPDLMVCPTYCRTTTITADPATGCPQCVCDFQPLPDPY